MHSKLNMAFTSVQLKCCQFTPLLKRVARLFSAFFLFAISIASAHSTESQDNSLWIPDADYFDKRAKHFRVFYSGLNVNANRAVFAFGKDSYNLITKFDDIAFDGVQGFGIGGPKVALVNIIKNQGIEAGMLFLNMYMKTPQQLSRELANKAMKDGIKAMNANYRMYKYGIDNLSASEKTEFRNNQILVDLLGPAKQLYISAGKDRGTFTKLDSVLNAIVELEDNILNTGIPSTALSSAKIVSIIERSKVPMDAYQPFVKYTQAISNTHRLNYKKQKEFKAKSPKQTDKNETQTQENSHLITNSWPISLTADFKKYRNNKHVKIFIVFEAKGVKYKDLSGAGLRVKGPQGKQLACNQPNKKVTPFGRCILRMSVGNGRVAESYIINEGNKGKFTVEFSVPSEVPADSVRLIKNSELKVNGDQTLRLKGVEVKSGTIKKLIHLTIQ